MALEAVIYSLDPFAYSNNNKEHYYGLLQLDNDYNNSTSSPTQHQQLHHVAATSSYWDSGIQVPQLLLHDVTSYNNYHSSSPEPCNQQQHQHQFYKTDEMVEEDPPSSSIRRKRRRRTKSRSKNKEEIENQRTTHIAVERNRRKQMNHYLALLRSLMPPSYVQRGDQASIIGGAINFVKELEQILQAVEARRTTAHQHHQQDDDDREAPCNNNVRLPLPSSLFSDFFTFPQYSTHQTQTYCSPEVPEVAVAAEPSSSDTPRNLATAVGEIEVTMVESDANIKILAKKQPSQLLKLVAQMQNLRLTILHLNITTTAHQMVLYSLSIKLEEGCHLNTVDEIVAAVNEMLRRIQQEAAFT